MAIDPDVQTLITAINDRLDALEAAPGGTDPVLEARVAAIESALGKVADATLPF